MVLMSLTRTTDHFEKIYKKIFDKFLYLKKLIEIKRKNFMKMDQINDHKKNLNLYQLLV